jgi:hypothetical protein
MAQTRPSNLYVRKKFKEKKKNPVACGSGMKFVFQKKSDFEPPRKAQISFS